MREKRRQITSAATDLLFVELHEENIYFGELAQGRERKKITPSLKSDETLSRPAINICGKVKKN